MNKRFFVYVLSNRRRGVLYVGVTSDLIRRLFEHKAKLVPGFTKTYGIVMLVYYEEYSSIPGRAHAKQRLNAGGVRGKWS